MVRMTPPEPQTPDVVEGWMLVPIEPTEQMVEAGDDCYGVARGTESWVIGGCKGSEKIWSEMLAAAPRPTEQPAIVGGVDRDEPAAWAVEAERAATEAYAAHMGDPNDDGYDDPSDARRAAARTIERHAVAALTARPSAPAEVGRCPDCDGTGDVHRIDGEWLGACHCEAATPAPAEVRDEDDDLCNCGLTKYRGDHSEWCLFKSPAPVEPRSEREALRAEIINTPETSDFMAGVPIEAAHQRERWGSDHHGGKTPEDWFWLIGYLAQKALRAQNAGDTDKAKHHTISTAAALANWHAALAGVDTSMRPGIEPPDALARPAADGAK